MATLEPALVQAMLRPYFLRKLLMRQVTLCGFVFMAEAMAGTFSYGLEGGRAVVSEVVFGGRKCGKRRVK